MFTFLLSQKKPSDGSVLADLGEPDIQYDEDKDFAFYQQLADQYIHIKPGQFAICFPEDGHAPLIGIGKQRKLIAKILI